MSALCRPTSFQIAISVLRFGEIYLAVSPVIQCAFTMELATPAVPAIPISTTTRHLKEGFSSSHSKTRALRRLKNWALDWAAATKVCRERTLWDSQILPAARCPDLQLSVS